MTQTKPEDQINEYGGHGSKKKESKQEFDSISNSPTDIDNDMMDKWIKRQWQYRAGIIK
jgi:hypothetical protein